VSRGDRHVERQLRTSRLYETVARPHIHIPQSPQKPTSPQMKIAKAGPLTHVLRRDVNIVPAPLTQAASAHCVDLSCDQSPLNDGTKSVRLGKRPRRRNVGDYANATSPQEPQAHGRTRKSDMPSGTTALSRESMPSGQAHNAPRNASKPSNPRSCAAGYHVV